MKFERKPKISLKKLTSNDVCERNLHAGDMVTPGLQRCLIEPTSVSALSSLSKLSKIRTLGRCQATLSNQ